MRKIVFRADGSVSIGLGHVIRSIALAEMLKEHFHCAFAIRHPSEALHKIITDVCPEIINLPNTNNKSGIEQELDQCLQGSEIVVLDGYGFDTAYQLHIKNKGCTLVCIDDIHAYHFVADVIINHGLINTSVYSKESYTKVLAGIRYALLRKPFIDQLNYDFSRKTENRVFLCFGGADALNLTCTYTKRLLQQQNISGLDIVVGSAFPHNEELKSLIKSNKDFVQVHRNISSEQLLGILQQCKVAIVPGSTIAIECASTGIPIICGYYVNNQKDIVQMLGETKLAVTVGDFLLLDEQFFGETLQKLLRENSGSWFQRSRLFFDGKTKERMVKTFQHLDLTNQIHLRKASQSDLHLIYEWANDPEVRKNAVNEMSIPFETHSRWFDTKLNSPDSHLFIASIGGKDFGQVRFDFDENSFKIDYSVGNDMRGKGLGIAMLDVAINQLQEQIQRPFKLSALVKDKNAASLKVFDYLQFQSRGCKQIDATNYVVFEKQIG